jgi:hypothetical protein
MRIPDDIRLSVYARVRQFAEDSNWLNLPLPEKSALYSTWGSDPQIGGVLLQCMSMNEVHRYIKDTLIKTYAAEKLSNPALPFAILAIPNDTPIAQTYFKPPGVLLEDERVIAWSMARDWKTTLFAVYERARESHGRPYAAVFLESEGQFASGEFRRTADDVRERFEIERIVWHPH